MKYRTEQIKKLALPPTEEKKRLKNLYKYEKVKLREQTRDKWRGMKKEASDENLLAARLAIGSLEREEYSRKKKEVWDTISSSSSDSSDSLIETSISNKQPIPQRSLQVKEDKSSDSLTDTSQGETETPVHLDAAVVTRPKKPWAQLVKDIELKYTGNAYDKIEYPFNGEFMARFEKIKSRNLPKEEEKERFYNLYRYQITQIEAEYGNMDFSREKKKLKKFLGLDTQNATMSKVKKTASGVKNSLMLQINRFSLGNLRV